eukprot:6509148-Prymnesium_polylepis.1
MLRWAGSRGALDRVEAAEGCGTRRPDDAERRRRRALWGVARVLERVASSSARRPALSACRPTPSPSGSGRHAPSTDARSQARSHVTHLRRGRPALPPPRARARLNRINGAAPSACAPAVAQGSERLGGAVGVGGAGDAEARRGHPARARGVPRSEAATAREAGGSACRARSRGPERPSPVHAGRLHAPSLARSKPPP